MRRHEYACIALSVTAVLSAHGQAPAPRDSTVANRAAFLETFADAYASLGWIHDSLVLIQEDRRARGDQSSWTFSPQTPADARSLPRQCTGMPPSRAEAVLDTLATWWQYATAGAKSDRFDAIRQCVLGIIDTLARAGTTDLRLAMHGLVTRMATADDPSAYLTRSEFAPHVAVALREARLRRDAGRYDRTIAQEVYARVAADEQALARLALGEMQLQAARDAARAAWGAAPSLDAALLRRVVDETIGDTAAVVQDLFRILVLAPTTSRDAASARQRLDGLRPAIRSPTLDAALDSVYDTEFRPLRPASEVRAGSRTAVGASAGAAHTVLLEVSTAPDCGPCGVVDRAIDGVLARYNPADVIVVAEHYWGPFAAAGDTLVVDSHIRAPGSFAARNEYYDRVTRRQPLPDGECSGFLRMDGRCLFGPSYLRDIYYSSAQVAHDLLVDLLDLWQPSVLPLEPTAHMRLSVASAGNLVHVRVVVDSARAGRGRRGPTRLAVRVFLVEDSLRYVGSNRVRVHRYVMRAFSGTSAHDFGFPPPATGGTVPNVTFDLARVRQQLRVANERYRKWENAQIAGVSGAGGGSHDAIAPYPETVYMLNPAHLGVVALVQDDVTGRVLQSVYQPLYRPVVQ